MAEDDQLGALEDFVRLKLEEADHRPSSAASSMSEAGFPDATSRQKLHVCKKQSLIFEPTYKSLTCVKSNPQAPPTINDGYA
jgi:hypothetical protein